MLEQQLLMTTNLCSLHATNSIATSASLSQFESDMASIQKRIDQIRLDSITTAESIKSEWVSSTGKLVVYSLRVVIFKSKETVCKQLKHGRVSPPNIVECLTQCFSTKMQASDGV